MKSLSRKAKQALKRPIQNAAKDWALGFAFPRAYARAAAELPVDERKVLFVDVKAGPDDMPDAFELMLPHVRDRYGMDVRYVGLGQNTGISWVAYYRRCLRFMHELACAKYVFLADACDVVSCVALRSGTKIVQLWHACGAFKKFGVSTADLQFGGTREEVRRHPFYKNLSLVTVSAPEVEWAYREAMMLENTPEVVRALGVSRTDAFFDEAYRETVCAEVRQLLAQLPARPAVAQACNSGAVGETTLLGMETAEDDASAAKQPAPQAETRKIILYAPTFRGKSRYAVGPDQLDIAAMKTALGDEYVLLIKHHPFVKKPPAIPRGCEDFAVDAGAFPIDWLLMVADVCISDYSSIVYEYSLLGRPMVFFAYDKDEYDDWRGFYYDYDEMTPGPVVKTTGEVINYIRGLPASFDAPAVAAFREKFMSACDGHATERICEYVMRT